MPDTLKVLFKEEKSMKTSAAEVVWLQIYRDNHIEV